MLRSYVASLVAKFRSVGYRRLKLNVQIRSCNFVNALNLSRTLPTSDEGSFSSAEKRDLCVCACVNI